MAGLGRWLMTREMRKKHMPSLDDLMTMARECGVTFSVCESSMRMMGIDRSELPEDLAVDMCGVAHLWDRAAGGQTIFI